MSVDLLKRKISMGMMMLVIISSSHARATDYLIEDGDNFGDLDLVNTDTLLMTGGEGHLLSLYAQSTATIENTKPALPETGSIWGIVGYDSSTINVSGGFINTIDGCNSSKITVSGGSVVWLILTDESTAHVSGGQFVDGFRVDDIDAEIHLYGYNFNIGPNHGSPLTGFWPDDTPFNIYLSNAPEIKTIDHITFHVIPEPSSFLLLCLGSCILKKKK